ncbi:MAG: Rieske (2Fe-2S) protein [Chloroflexi bacterium]|nr:Rieske (2Fe-2S) protein [Chloroflexota bacterium]
MARPATVAQGHQRADTADRSRAAPVTPRTRYVRVAARHEIPPDTMRVFEVDGFRIVVVNSAGELYALDNQCPHLGGPLDRGTCDDGIITCPWHGWRFNVRTGRAVWPAGVWGAARFPLKVEDDEVYVRVS